jgi:hypothetical protein
MQSDVEAMKKYYSEEAWCKVEPRYEQGPSQEWIDLIGEVEAALDEDPASEKVQELAARWMALSSDDPEVREGNFKAWADRMNWPAALQQRMDEFHMDKIAPFIGQAITAYRKKYYSEEAWAKISQRTEEEKTQIHAEWRALWKEVAAVLDEDPASEKAQELCAKWADLAERSSGGDPEVKAGNRKEGADHKNWPAFIQLNTSSVRLEEVIAFIGKAYVVRAKKEWLRTHQPASSNP